MNCTICGEAGHRATRCKELANPLKDGFQGGGGGGGGSHDHDEDDKCTAFIIHSSDFILAEDERCAKATPRAPAPAPAQPAAPRQTQPAP